MIEAIFSAAFAVSLTMLIAAIVILSYFLVL